MGIFEKIKNALFEVEYVEVEDQPKTEIEKHREEVHEDTTLEKPIAKKIVLPGRREEKVEELKEEALKDENFEVRPLDETRKENIDFKFMDDDDFTVDTEPPIEREVVPIPVEVPAPAPTNVEVATEVTAVSPIYAESVPVSDKDYVREYDSYKQKVSSTLNAEYKYKERESRPYGMDPSYNVSIKEYGSYENKDERAYFKPSPIISPIYGVLDKNYKKEDVVSKKDIRITSNYSRTNVNVDSIRDKAYGLKETIIPETEPPTENPSFEVEEEDENLLVDLSDDKEKPEVKEVTVGDAMDYFNDLGLEYNVDYVDVSNKVVSKKKNEDLEEDIKKTMDEETVPVPSPVLVKSEPVEEKEEPKKEIIEEKQEEKEVEDDDNLFDLIDSMYKDKED